eukprot:217160_1
MVPDSALELIQMAICCGCSLILLITLVYHALTAYRATHSIDSTVKFKYHSVLSLSFILIVVGLIYSIFGSVTSYILYNHGTTDTLICDILVRSFVFFYSIFKFVMYYTLATRLELTYASRHIYKERFYLVWKCFLVLTFCPLIVAGFIFIGSDPQKISQGFCRAYVPWRFAIIFVVYDTIICGVNLYLFLKPLKRLIPNGSETESTEIRSFEKLIKKNAILASIAILTSLLVWILILMVNAPPLWQSIDCMVSSFCIVFLFKWYGPIYDILCCQSNMEEEMVKATISA